MPSIRYLLTYATHEISSFISYLAVLIISFQLTSVEAGKMFSYLKVFKTKLLTQVFQDFLNALIKIRHDFNNFDKIKEKAVDKLRHTK